jgi:hypothetical protein
VWTRIPQATMHCLGEVIDFLGKNPFEKPLSTKKWAKQWILWENP